MPASAIIASLDIILFFTYPNEAYHACITLVLSKLYSNSLLVLFNSQIQIVGARSLEPDNDTGHAIGNSSGRSTAIDDDFAMSPGNSGGNNVPRKIALRYGGTPSVSGSIPRPEDEWMSDNVDLDQRVGNRVLPFTTTSISRNILVKSLFG